MADDEEGESGEKKKKKKNERRTVFLQNLRYQYLYMGLQTDESDGKMQWTCMSTPQKVSVLWGEQRGKRAVQPFTPKKKVN